MYTFLAVRRSHSSRRQVLLSTQAVLSLEMDSHLRIDWGDMNLCFWWFKLDCYSLNLKPFHLYKSSKNLIDCLLFLFRGHHNQLANVRGSRWSDYSGHCSDSTVPHGNCAHLDVAVELCHLHPAPWDLIPISLRDQSLVAGSSSQGNFWPSEKSNHRALQGGWGCPHNLFLTPCGRTVPKWMSRSKWWIHSNICISLGLCIPSSMVYKGSPGISTSFNILPFGPYFSKPANKLVEFS